jgi:hypothetical protein
MKPLPPEIVSGAAQAIRESVKPDTETKCWLWTGRRDSTGVPLLIIGGVRVPLVRHVYEAATREDTGADPLIRTCSTRECLSPHHRLRQRSVARRVSEQPARPGRAPQARRPDGARLSVSELPDLPTERRGPAIEIYPHRTREELVCLDVCLGNVGEDELLSLCGAIAHYRGVWLARAIAMEVPPPDPKTKAYEFMQPDEHGHNHLIVPVLATDADAVAAIVDRIVTGAGGGPAEPYDEDRRAAL